MLNTRQQIVLLIGAGIIMMILWFPPQLTGAEAMHRSGRRTPFYTDYQTATFRAVAVAVVIGASMIALATPQKKE